MVCILTSRRCMTATVKNVCKVSMTNTTSGLCTWSLKKCPVLSRLSKLIPFIKKARLECTRSGYSILTESICCTYQRRSLLQLHRAPHQKHPQIQAILYTFQLPRFCGSFTSWSFTSWTTAGQSRFGPFEDEEGREGPAPWSVF